MFIHLANIYGISLYETCVGSGDTVRIKAALKGLNLAEEQELIQVLWGLTLFKKRNIKLLLQN